jgi:glycolate oxidase iron-sulfur subunit
VRYDRLIELTRVEVERQHVREPEDRAVRGIVFSLFPYPRRLRLLRPTMWLAERMAPFLARANPSLGAMAALAPRVERRQRLPRLVRARGERRATVGMLLGCVQREFFPQVNAATARVLALEGCDVVVPPEQGCCGALSVHSGRDAQARRLAGRTIRAFERAGVDTVVVNAAGCGSSMKEYAELLGHEPPFRVVDLSEYLAELGPVAKRHPLPLTVAYHDACHLAHAQGVRAQPRELLSAIPELELREIPESAICCGSAGTYNLLQPEAARDLGDRKARAVGTTGAELLVSANPGCTMQIAAAMRRGGATIRVAHTAEVLDASLRGVML